MEGDENQVSTKATTCLNESSSENISRWFLGSSKDEGSRSIEYSLVEKRT